MSLKNIDVQVLSEDDELVACADGYFCSIEDEQISIFLNKIIPAELVKKVICFLKSRNVQKLAVLKNINVEEEYRGLGYGNQVMNSVLDLSFEEDVDLIILQCDTYELNCFSLEKWYKSFCFENLTEFDEFKAHIGEQSINQIMCKF